MNAPDVLEIIDDPEVGGGVALRVIRKTSTRVRSGYEKRTERFNVTGNIQPASKSTQSSTAEDLLNESITVYAVFVFQNGDNNGLNITEPDEIHWKGKVYRVMSVNDWSEWGFTVATAERVRDRNRG